MNERDVDARTVLHIKRALAHIVRRITIGGAGYDDAAQLVSAAVLVNRRDENEQRWTDVGHVWNDLSRDAAKRGWAVVWYEIWWDWTAERADRSGKQRRSS